MALLFISFLAGVLTVLAPCILPLIPVIVGRSLTDATLSKKRLFTVVIALGTSIILFTLILKVSTLFINIPQEFWKYFSSGIIFVFGLVTLFPEIWEKFSLAEIINRKSNVVLAEGYKKNNLWGDILIGASLGPIFSACSPTYFVILATVLPARFGLGLVYLIVYSFGLSLALLVIAFLGQKLVLRLGLVVDSRGWFKRIMGLLFILVAILIFSGYDKKFQIYLLEKGFLDVTKIEQKLLDENSNTLEEIQNGTKQNPTDIEATNIKSNTNFLSIKEKNLLYPLAPDLSTIDADINTPLSSSGQAQSITISQFKGKKVVLLDIWTYSCINCQRTIPYLNEWYKKYEDEGLVIIGLHTPEFAFEKVEANVRDAVKRFGIKYPVVMDNDFSTWNAYGNRYWPRKYLIDVDGYVVYDHAGEGEYDTTEREIQKALQELNYRLNTGVQVSTGIINPTNKIVVSGEVGSPETYFGSDRNEYLANGEQNKTGEQALIISNKNSDIILNKLYLGGVWNFTPEYARGSVGGEIVFKYKTKNVYMTTGSTEGAELEVYVDDKLTKTIKIKTETLYTLVEDTDYSVHTLKLRIKSGTLKAFTFTFG